MKIRKGFVSNSSSSSFIIAFNEKEENKCPTCGRSDEEAIELLRRTVEQHWESEVEVDGYKEIIKHIEDWYIDDKKIIQIKNKMKELNRKGYDFILIDIGYHDDVSKKLLKDNRSIEIIYKGDDY